MAKQAKVHQLNNTQLRVLGNMIRTSLGPVVHRFTSQAQIASNKAMQEYETALKAWHANTKDAMLAEARRRPSTYIVNHDIHGVTLDLQKLYGVMEKKYPKPAKPAKFDKYSDHIEVVFASLGSHHGDYGMTFNVPKDVAPVLQALAFKIDAAVLAGVGDGLVEAIATAADSIRALTQPWVELE